MRQTQLFSKTFKQAPKDEIAVSAQLLLRGGFIHKEMAGVYDVLPLGLRVLKKIEQIIREEMNGIGGVELSLTALQDPELWKTSGRWSDEVVDNWFKTALKNDALLGLGFSHEEPLTNLLRDHIQSYRDLPVYLYQFQTKFRNELRAKSGLLRAREFLMKDLYSFCKDQTEHEAFYAACREAYRRIFQRVGIGDVTFLTFASGGTFSRFSEEFQAITEAGEDTIYVYPETGIAVNREVHTPEVLAELGLTGKAVEEHKAIEVGNIFPLGTKYSEPFGLTYLDQAGVSRPVYMGSYGIGLGRLLATVVEVHHDERGIRWPELIAPFQTHLLVLGDDPAVVSRAEEVYQLLSDHGVEVLYDDRPGITPGQKFSEADLLGLPHRLVVSAKTAERVEWKRRTDAAPVMLAADELIKTVTG